MSTNEENTKALSTQLQRREVSDDTWNALRNTIFPGATNASILMAVDYCRARKLDILKKPVHIVPMPYMEGDVWKVRDVVMPGINEVRVTAMRTGLYMGNDEPIWGESKSFLDGGGPEFCTYTVYRRAPNGEKIAFSATVWFTEACGTTGKGDKTKVNAMWLRRPRGQLEKCAEAAALRKAFPEEIGNDYIPDEVQHGLPEDTASTVTTLTAGGVAGTRTNAAMEALKSKQGVLTNQAGTGGLDQAVDSGSPIREDAKPAAANKAELKTREAEWEDKKPAAAQQNRRDAFRYDAESAVAALRAQTSLEALKQTFEMISDDYAFSGREMPVDIDANFTFAKEEFEQGTRQ